MEAIETTKNEDEQATNEPTVEIADKEEPMPLKPEFSYLKRQEFTSEVFKIEVRNLGFFGIGELKRMLKARLNLDISKVKSPRCREYAYVCLRSKEDQDRALTLLNGYKWKGKVLRSYRALPSADPLMKRRHENKNEKEDEELPEKKKRTALQATCPFAEYPYETQINEKQKHMQLLLEEYSNELGRLNISGSCKFEADFKFEGVEKAEQINGYRNKNEFTVGRNATGDIIVGFRLGSYIDGTVEVGEIDNVPHVPDAAKWAAKTFQEFVRSSKFLPFNPEQNSGHIRQLMVRSSFKTNELMLVPGVYSSNLNKEELVELKKSLKEFYENYKDDRFKCTSLYYQDLQRRTAGQVFSPVEHLWGTTHITDAILDLDFRISPLSFFQVNTKMADVLYKKAIEYAGTKPNSTVLDICCGTGSIGLAFAKHCQQVLGVEIVPEAIKDAEFNAAANGIKNCKFITGNADDYIQSMVRQASYGNATDTDLDIVAVVDPPRNGLHNRSIAAIRAAKAIKRLVYISCNPVRAKRNWLDLGRRESKQYQGDPFFASKAVAVDMFPHTDHVELIVLFERYSTEESQNNQPPKDENVDIKNDDDVKKTDDEKKDSVEEETITA